MNPLVPQAIIDDALEADPAAATSEYLAEFRSDIESFVSAEAIDSVIIPNRFDLPPVTGTRYTAFCDPAGGSGTDSFTLAIGHAERDTAVLDLIRERKPRFSPEEVVREFSEDLKRYGVHQVVGDRYAGEWPREQFLKNLVNYKIVDKPKSEIYQSMLPMLNSGRVELLDSKTLRTQLLGLERRTARSGKDSIDHRFGAHDDIVNAAAGVLTLCTPTVELTPDMFAQGTISFSRKPSEERNFMGAMMSSIRARLEVAEALLTDKLSREEARARRAELLKRSRRGRMLLRIERIERAVEGLEAAQARPGVVDAYYR